MEVSAADPESTDQAARRREPDALLASIADYVMSYRISSEVAYETAYYCLMDALACAFQALGHRACSRLLGPLVPGATMPGGARVPGTSFELDPVQAAFNIATMIRWLDFNDTWLAAEWGHPSDNLGAIVAVADYVSRCNVARGRAPLSMREVLTSLIKAYEIQGVIALENSFNRVGLDHVLLVRVASTAVAAAMLGATRQQLIAAISNAWIDGAPLRVYRHAPDAGSRKGWAAGDASARAVRLALLALSDEMGYPTALTAPTWGFQEVLFQGQTLKLARAFGSYVVENILFKIAHPAEFHGQSAVEAALSLHGQVSERIERIARVDIQTQSAGMRIIDKTGPLSNPADRDHCIQYMVAIALIFGRLTAADYEEAVARDPRVDALRAKMTVSENPRFTREYLDADKRHIGNAVQVFFDDGSATARVMVDFPIGHRRRRAEALPLLVKKFETSVTAHFSPRRTAAIKALFADRARVEQLPVQEFMAELVRN